MIWAWVISLLLCALLRKPLERFVSIRAALMVSFLGIFTLGAGLLVLGFANGVNALDANENGYCLLWFLLMAFGGLALKTSFRPLLRTISSRQ